MTSLQSAAKQLPANAGYFITVADLKNFWLQNNGTKDAPSMVSGISSLSTLGNGVSTLIEGAGKVLRDHGVTLVSSGRVFRKVQIVVPNSPATEGVSGAGYGVANTTPFLTGYIELPGRGGQTSGGPLPAPVARLG